MAFLYEKSATWRWIVRTTKHSPLYMATFGVAFVAVPYVAGKLVMAGTNPENIKPEWEQQLKARQTVDYKARIEASYSGPACSCKRADHQPCLQLLARANKERLAQLLKETQERTGEQRYAAALRYALACFRGSQPSSEPTAVCCRGESLGTQSSGSSAGKLRGITSESKPSS